MKIGLLAKKIGMTRIFAENGEATAVTVLQVEPSTVSQIKTDAKDGYNAVQLAACDIAERKLVKAQKVFFEKAGIGPKKYLYELRSESPIDGVSVGDVIGMDNFEDGGYVDITGTSIGKGFQGVMKRHHFHGGRASHGDSTGRRGGSIGQSASPSRVFKGMKMPGRMGGESVTIQNLRIVGIEEDNVLLIKGAVPGFRGSMVTVFRSLKKANDAELKIEQVEVEDVSVEEVVDQTADVVVDQPDASESVVTEQADAAVDADKKE